MTNERLAASLVHDELRFVDHVSPAGLSAVIPACASASENATARLKALRLMGSLPMRAFWEIVRMPRRGPQ
jgi:hypothetical protein